MMKGQKMMQSIGKSEIDVKIPGGGGFKASGPIAIISVTFIFILLYKWISTGKAKKHVSGAVGRIKKRFKKK